MNTKLSIVAFQETFILGDVQRQITMIIDKRSSYSTCDLLIFPECFISGYPLEDLTLRPDFINEVGNGLKRLAEAIKAEPGPAVLVGAPIAGNRLPFNAAVLIRRDGTTSVTTKTELPNSDVFDEVRTFARNTSPALPLELDGWRLGVAICEDIWHPAVARSLAGELSDCLLVLNGSPFEHGKDAIRRAHVIRRAREIELPALYLNLVGGQDEIVFDGASFVTDANGDLVSQAPSFEEAVLLLEFTKDTDRPELGCRVSASSTPASRLLSSEEAMWSAAVLGLRDYVHKTGHKKVLLGVSGGIDSAVVATMAADALGSENVTGVMLPSRHTSQLSVELADDLMRRLGIERRLWSIDDTFASAQGVLSDEDGAGLSVALENMQSRIRGLALMAISNAEGHLVLTTGNKSEMSVGYATLYGDMNGGFNPLKDVYKTDVFNLALWRNANIPFIALRPIAQPIPREIIARPPSAELSAGQIDENALGSYDVLDALLKGIIERNLEPQAARREAEQLLDRAIDPEHADRIATLIARSEFKRRQAPPGVKMTARSFGKGWRYPIAHKARL